MGFTYAWKILPLHLLILSNIINSKSILENSSLEKIEDVCPSQTCKVKENLDGARWCSCDRTCVKFGDCCIDAVKEPPDEEAEIPFLNSTAQCFAIPSLGFCLVVTTCPNVTESNSTEASRLLCSKDSSEAAKSHILDIPVSSSLSGLTYRNVHCAFCNLDARHLLPRRAVLKIDPIKGSPADNPKEWIYQDGSLSWIHSSSHSPTVEDSKFFGKERSYRRKELSSTEQMTSSEMEKLRVTLATKTEDNLKNMSVRFFDGSPVSHLASSKESMEDTERKGKKEQSIDKINFEYSGKTRLLLDSNHIRHCHPSYCDRVEDNDLALKCSSYLMPVYGIQETEEDEREEKKNKIFRNPHCAICNGVLVVEQNCLPKPYREKNLDTKDKNNEAVHFEFIFGDVMTGDKRCGLRSVWDPLFKQCYSIDNGKSTEPPMFRNLGEKNQIIEQEELTFSEESGEKDICEYKTLLTMSNVQWYLASAFFGVSIACLVLCVLIHIGTRRPTESTLNNAEKRELQSNLSDKMFIKDRSFHIFAWLLVLGQILFIAASRRPEVKTVCLAIAVAHNFLSLSTISWFSAFCLRVFQAYFSIKSLKSTNATNSESEVPSLKLSLIAWAIPITFSCLFLILEILPGTFKPCLARGGACWYGEAVSFKILFVLPALLMLAGDGCIFTAIMFGIREKQRGDTSSDRRGKYNSHVSRRRSSSIAYNDRRKFRLCIRMGLLIFIAWICAAIASLGGFTSMWYGFVIFSGLQGVFVFVSSGAKSRVTEIIWVKATGKPSPEAESRSKRKTVKSDAKERPTVISQK